MPSRGGADTDGSADHTDRPQSAAEAEGGCGPLQPGSRVDAAGRYCDVLLRGCCSRESVGDEKRLGGRPVPSFEWVVFMLSIDDDTIIDP